MMEKKLKIIFEDQDLLVIDKDSGTVVNRSETVKKEITLQDMVASYLGLKQGVLGIGDRAGPPANAWLWRAGIVHRLDRETSGLIIVGKSEEAFQNLQSQFKKRVVEKTYLALSHGDFGEDRGVIEFPLGRHPKVRTKFLAMEGGREAKTEFEVLKRLQFSFQKLKNLGLKIDGPFASNYNSFSYLSLYPKTGRTHQIRVHLKSIQKPIVSDPLYVGRKFLRLDRKWCPRLFLHAEKIRFKHPKTNQTVEFESKLPGDLEEPLKNLEKIN